MAAEPCRLVPGLALRGLEARGELKPAAVPLLSPCWVLWRAWCGRRAGVSPCMTIPLQAWVCAGTMRNSAHFWHGPVRTSILQTLSASDPLGCPPHSHHWRPGPRAPRQLLSPLISSPLSRGSCILVLHTCFSWSLGDFVQFSPLAKDLERLWLHKDLLLSLSYSLHGQQPCAGHSCCL